MSKKTGKAAGKPVTKATVNGRRTVKSAKAKMAKPEIGYKGHFVGSRKGTVHETFDKAGADEALTHGVGLGLKPGTIKSWIGTWQREGSAKKPAKAA